MSTIFLSHSSRDNDVAALVKSRLDSWGYQSVFLDFDPSDGIPAGRQWERELYAQLRTCQAVIVLCSDASMASPWCFAEITHAKALGKHVFPVKVAACQVHHLLDEFQVLDAMQSPEENFGRLKRGLESAGLDPKSIFVWKRDRPPYPGLQSFDRDDAGVYFGRDGDIQAVLEKLTTWQRLPGTRLALIVGASGSGKSSLVRAGVLPRLGRDSAHWLVLDPFRPQGQPMDQFAAVLDATLGRAQRSVGWKLIREILRSDEETRQARLADLFTDLRSAAGQLDATVVITIDQAEELFTLTPTKETDAFLAALKTCLELSGNAALALATLRSDFLAAWQERPAGSKPAVETIPLEQMGPANFAEIIEKPSVLAELDLEPGLVQAMVADTGTQDALPLLAFALNTLWHKHGNDRKWTLAEYRTELGGLHGVIARAAEKVLKEANPTAEEELQLRCAFSAMVRVNDADQYVRHPARSKDLPQKIQPLIDRFAKERLLVFRGDSEEERTVEVAHEALFRSWNRLQGWLNEDREFFLWRRRLKAAVQAWQEGGKDISLVWRDAPLAQAERFLLERLEFLETEEREFIAKGIGQRKAAEHRRRLVRASLAVGLILALALSVFAGYQWLAVKDQTRKVLARQLATDAESVFGKSAGSLTLSTLLAIESLKADWTVDAYKTLLERLDLLPPRPKWSWKAHEDSIAMLAISDDGRWLASTDKRDVAVWDLEEGRNEPLRRLVPEGARLSEHAALAISPNRDWLVAGCEKWVCVWRTEDWHSQPYLQNHGADDIWSLAFSADGKILAAAGYHSSSVVMYGVGGSWHEFARLPEGASIYPTPAIAFVSPPNLIATASDRGEGLRLWQLEPGGPKFWSIKGDWQSVAVSPGGDVMAAQGSKGISVWALRDNGLLKPPIATFEHDFSGQLEPRTFAISNAGRYLAVAPSASVWDLKTKAEVMRFEEGVAVQTISNKNLLVSGNRDKIEIRPLGGVNRAIARLDHGSPVVDVDFSADGTRFATAYAGGIRVYEAGSWKQRSIPLEGGAVGVRMSSDGRLVAAWSGSKFFLFDASSGELVNSQKEPADVSLAVFDPKASVLAVVANSAVDLVQTAKPYDRKQIKTVPDRAAFSPDGKWLATYTNQSCQRANLIGYAMTEVWDSKTGEPAARRPHEDTCGGFLEDNASKPESKGDPELLDKADKNWLMISKDPNEIATQDGRWRASKVGSELEEVGSGRKVKVVLHDGEVKDAEFSPNSRWLVTASQDGSARVWALTADGLIKEACERLERNLSKKEWDGYLAPHLGDAKQAKTCDNLPIRE